MKVLHLTLKKKWFDMIASGVKREEYRELKPYWFKRLKDRAYDVVKFRNGYRSDSPTVTVECYGISIDLGQPEWGAPEHAPVFVIHLGGIIT